MPRSKHAPAFPVEPAALGVCQLALFVGLAGDRLLLGQLAQAGFGDLREAHGFVVQHLLGGARGVSELGKLLGVTQQAASKQVAELQRAGYVEDAPAGPDARVRTVQLAARGHACVRAARTLRARLERELAAQLGPERAATLRATLAEVLEQLGGSEAVRQRRVRGGDAQLE